MTLFYVLILTSAMEFKHIKEAKFDAKRCYMIDNNLHAQISIKTD